MYLQMLLIIEFNFLVHVCMCVRVLQKSLFTMYLDYLGWQKVPGFKILNGAKTFLQQVLLFQTVLYMYARSLPYFYELIISIPLISRVQGPYGELWIEFFPSFYGPSAKCASHENKEGKNEDP